MTSGGSTFIDFLENQLTKFRAVLTVLRQIGTTRSFVQSKIFHCCVYKRLIPQEAQLSPRDRAMRRVN